MKLTNNLFFYPEKGMLDCNTYVLRDDISIVIDPGSTQFFPGLIQDLYKDGIDPKDIDIITNTHLHIDHYGANEALKEISGAKILVHPLQREFYDITVIRTSQFFGLQGVEFKEDGYLDNGKLSSSLINSKNNKEYIRWGWDKKGQLRLETYFDKGKRITEISQRNESGILILKQKYINGEK